MKAPDKIYVREFAGGLNQMWSSIIATETSAIAQHEYIRKDVLVEWLQSLYEEYSERSKAGEMVHQIAGTYLDVINHIKEM